MNQTIKFLATASLALSGHYPKIYPQTIVRRQLNVVAESFSYLPKTFESCQKHMEKLSCEMANTTSEFVTMNNKDDLSISLQKMQVVDAVTENINNMDKDIPKECAQSTFKKQSADQDIYKQLRYWRKIQKEPGSVTDNESFVFKVFSYNILAQQLLELHPDMYKYHNATALSWKNRKPLLIDEILSSEAHVVCLQEVQEDHLQEILDPFQVNGFKHLYKKRTSNKKDGLLLLYKDDLFTLIKYSKVEFYQIDVDLLDRDNVGVVAKFALKESPQTEFVVATTHLLYNPRRSDVRLGQMQVLFAEIERLAYIKNTSSGPKYLPIILTGDFNFEPNSGVYKFITEGSILFNGKGRNLENYDYRYLTNSLFSSALYVTDECQHFKVLTHRLFGKGSGKTMLKNTEDPNTYKTELSDSEESSQFDSNSSEYQRIEVADNHFVTFSSGLLTHPFKLKSVYEHIDKKGYSEATTFQDRWITVDYIFYNNVEPIARYTLPTVEECSKFLPTIPNGVVGSDHLSIGAMFQIKKR